MQLANSLKRVHCQAFTVCVNADCSYGAGESVTPAQQLALEGGLSVTQGVAP
jgi:hypothetical protein